MNELVWAVAGLGLGFGASAVLFMKVVVRKLEQLVNASQEAAAKLDVYHEEGVQKVEEQNMHAVLKRMDDVERKLNEGKRT